MGRGPVLQEIKTTKEKMLVDYAQATGWHSRRTCRSCRRELRLVGNYWTCETEHGSMAGKTWARLPKATNLPKGRYRVPGKEGMWVRLLPHGRMEAYQIVAAVSEYGRKYATATILAPYVPPPVRVPYKRDAKCSTPDCRRKVSQGCRGMCKACVTKVRAVERAAVNRRL